MVLTKGSKDRDAGCWALFGGPGGVACVGDQVEMGKSEKVYQRRLSTVLLSGIASHTGLRRCRGAWLRSESFEFIRHL